jgi:SAM-dependent methyltransferase
MDRTAETIASYDDCAVTYARTFRRFPLYEEPRRQFASLLSDGARIVDLGCGPGTSSAYLRDLRRGFVLDGCDLSPEMISVARREVPEARFNIQDLRQPWTSLRGPYDALVASFCIVHLDAVETDAFIDRLPSLCRDGSLLFLSWIEGSGSGFEHTSFGGPRRFWYCRHEGHALRSRLERGGWELLRHMRVRYLNPDGTFDPESFFFARWSQTAGVRREP